MAVDSVSDDGRYHVIPPLIDGAIEKISAVVPDHRAVPVFVASSDEEIEVFPASSGFGVGNRCIVFANKCGNS